jgi:hypothetical protein
MYFIDDEVDCWANQQQKQKLSLDNHKRQENQIEFLTHTKQANGQLNPCKKQWM